MEANRRLDALDLSVPRGKPRHRNTQKPANTCVSLSPSASSVDDAPTTEATLAPRLDTRRVDAPRRSKMSRQRREAKARRYDDASASSRGQHTSYPRAAPSRTLEIRVHHAVPSSSEEEESVEKTSFAAPQRARPVGGGTGPPPVAHKSRPWKHPNPTAGRKAMSMPPQRSSQFVVVDDDDVEDTSTPVCGIDLGPFLSWLSCMPVIPEEAPGTET